MISGFSAARLTAVVYGTLGGSSLGQVCSGISSSCHSNKISDGKRIDHFMQMLFL